ncbi:MAG: hypothetical protein AAFR94_08490 [Pseudomonadota bacterium]
MIATLLPRKSAVGLAMLGAAATVAPAAASVVDNPHFKALGMIVVWGGDATGVPIVSDFILDTGSGAADIDLIAQNGQAVVTGSFIPLDSPLSGEQGAPVRIRSIAGGGRIDADTNGDRVMDDTDAFGSFGLRNSTDNRTRRMELDTSFYVASNLPFSIDATATPQGSTTIADLQRVRATLSVTLSGDDGVPFGVAAQFPHTSGATGGRRMNRRRLSSMTGGFNVFNGNQATAASVGTLAEQSVRFDLNYRYNFGNVDLSQGVIDVEAEVVYTLYMP